MIVGAYINDIQELDTERGTYTIDFYMWFRWKDPQVDPTDSIEVMNSNAMENTTSSATGGVSGRPFPSEPRVMPDGSKYQGFRYQGVFSKNMDLAPVSLRHPAAERSTGGREPGQPSA